jgi:hypothetical protein
VKFTSFKDVKIMLEQIHISHTDTHIEHKLLCYLKYKYKVKLERENIMKYVYQFNN